MSVPALAVRGLSVRVHAGKVSKQVVDSVSFDIQAGETLGLVGESGCGKTMTAMAIMGLLHRPVCSVYCDQLAINGDDISTLSASQKRSFLGQDIAMVFQQPGSALDPVFTIGQQISFVYRRHIGGKSAGVKKAVLASLESAGFSDPGAIAAAYPHQLSGGMRQLAMIAMAMVCKPAVIIADEPTTALDAESASLVLQQLKQLQATHNTAILLISHDLSVIRTVSSKVMVMYCGRIVEEAGTSELFAAPRHPYSAGLISCIPQLGKGAPKSIQPIPGQVPGELPAGCHFAPRCNRSVPGCSESVPKLDPASGRSVACFRPLP
jgi:oligopeptide/dipeptide ABC transporter ATP-binding protein